MPHLDPDKIAQQVASVLARVKGRPLENVAPASRIVEDLGFQSIDMVQLMIEVQTEFGIALAPEDFIFENFSTVSAITDLVARYLSQPPDVATSLR
jgi:acyl carrier protein